MKQYFIKRKISSLVFSTLGLLIITSCSSSIETISTFNDNQIVVDGSYKDWGRSINYVKDDNIAFGFKNDKNNLYMAIVTADRSKIMKVLSGGLTVWISSDQDKIGIEFPLKLDPGELQEIKPMQNNSVAPFERGDRIKALIQKNNQLQVIDKNNQLLYTGSANLGPDFVCKLNYDSNQLADEIKIPIANNEITQKVFSKDLRKINVSFVTGEIERKENRERQSPMMTNDEGFYNDQGNGGRGWGNRQQRGQMDSNPLEYSFEVTLSK